MIGIHMKPGSFSDRWVSVCQQEGIGFRTINCLKSDIIAQCDGLDAVLWHWSHGDVGDVLVARQVIRSLETKGLVLFPNSNTCWHFDDKVGQKYLLEAIGAPLCPTWVWTNIRDAMNWIDGASWPKVFKLRCGAGSSNVRLVWSRAEARKLCYQAFGHGFPAVSGYFSDMKTRGRNVKSVGDLLGKVARAPESLLNFVMLRRKLHRERGYIYFQEFLPKNASDTRITIIGDRAFGFTRRNRLNDFRASGSGSIDYDPQEIDKRCVEIAFRVADRLRTQSLAFDFLYGYKREPIIIEISYCYKASAVYSCEGWWDHEFVWHKGHVWPQDAILKDLMIAVDRKNHA